MEAGEGGARREVAIGEGDVAAGGGDASSTARQAEAEAKQQRHGNTATVTSSHRVCIRLPRGVSLRVSCNDREA
jgi:hypothetical protein